MKNILLVLIQLMYVMANIDTQTSWHSKVDDNATKLRTRNEPFNISTYTYESPWWIMNQTANTAFDAFKEEKIYLRKVNLDEQMLHSCYEYRTMFVNPAGIESEHKHGYFCYPAIIVTGMPKCSTSALYALLAKVPGVYLSHIKENCPFTSTSIVHWFDSHPTSLKFGQVYVDACIDLPGNMIMRKMLKNPETFYIIMTRDYSSWLWSAYNFWCNHRLEKACDARHHFAEIELHSRSPSEFDYIVQNSANHSAINNIIGVNTCDLAKDFYRSYIQLLIDEQITEDKYIVLASEELSSDVESFTRKLSLLSGLPLDNKIVNYADFRSFRFNTQSNKGADHKVPIEEFQEGLYPISNNQPMFNETRITLDKCWGDDCKWVSREASYNFRACPDVDIKANPVRPLYHDKAPEHVGFIHRSKEYCRKRSERNKLAFDSVKSEYEMPAEKVVFFCVSKTVRFDFMTLVQSTLGTDISMDISSLDDINPTNYNDRIKQCKSSYILGINPGKSENIDELKWKIISEFKRACVLTNGLSQEQFEYKKLDVRAIVYANMWPKTYLWQSFIKENPADYELLVQKHSSFSWMKWDADIFNRTSLYAVDNHVMIKVDVPQLKQFSEVELYDSSLNKEKVLRSIYRYIRLPRFGFDDVACDFMQLAALKNYTVEEKALAKSTQYIEAAYSSNEAYCAFEKLNFHLPENKKQNVSCDASSSDEYPYEMCKLRYSQKRFLELNELFKYEPIALLTVDRHEINTRLLLEYAVGIYSGTTNVAIKNMFHADSYCGRRMALNYVNPDIVTLKITKAGHRTIHINKYIRMKCLKGLIRGFNRGILVIDDPFHLVYPSVLNHLARHHNSTKNMDDESIRHLALSITNDFNKTWIFPHREIKMAADTLQSADEYRMITYESLFDETVRMSVLRSLAAFMRFDKLDNQRLACAFSFLDRPTFLNIQGMLEVYRREEKLTCYMNHLFSSKLNGTDIHFRLFQNDNKIC